MNLGYYISEYAPAVVTIGVIVLIVMQFLPKKGGKGKGGSDE